MELDAIKRVIIEAVAHTRGQDIEELMAELDGAGTQPSIGSLELVEILVPVSELIGVRIDPSELNERQEVLGSVAALASYFREVRSRGAVARRGA